MSTAKLTYPDTRREPTTDKYPGDAEVTEYYRWLEDPDSPETQQWVEQQNKITQQLLTTECTARDPLKEHLTSTYNFPRLSPPELRAGVGLFWYANSGLQNQSVLYKLLDSSAEEIVSFQRTEGIRPDKGDSSSSILEKQEVLLDPNTLAEDATAAVSISELSDDGKYLAAGISRSGSDWVTIDVIDTKTNKSLPEKLDWVKFSGVSWTHDNAGFFYSRYPTPKQYADKADDNYKRGSETEQASMHALYYHKLNTDQKEDVLVYVDEAHPKWMYHGDVSNDGNTLLIGIAESTAPVNRLFVLPLKNHTLPTTDSKQLQAQVIKLVDNFDAQYRYVTNLQNTYYFRTNDNAPKYKLIAATLDFSNASAKPQWKDVIPEHETKILNSLTATAGHLLLAVYMSNVSERLEVYNLPSGKHIADVVLPDIGCIGSISAQASSTILFFHFTSFLYAGTIFRLDMQALAQESTTTEPSGALKNIEAQMFQDTNVTGINPSNFHTEQKWFKSKDGTEVPMFIIRHKSTPTNQPTPTLQYGYGGFNISLLPSFAVSRLVWCQSFAATYVLVNIRGGGEFGESWHKAGTKTKKQNCFDDFHAAAEYLIEQKVTTPKQLAINGGSNGGLLVAACLNQRPDLYACGVAAVGVLDMLRFHKFTIGFAWCSDYGCSEESKEEFEALHRISPLHNIPSDKQYPATMLTTADHDDRVVPLHSFKFISELQHQRGNASDQHLPLVIRIETKAGHGAGMSLTKRIQEQADVLAFIARYTGAKLQK